MNYHKPIYCRFIVVGHIRIRNHGTFYLPRRIIAIVGFNQIPDEIGSDTIGNFIETNETQFDSWTLTYNQINDIGIREKPMSECMESDANTQPSCFNGTDVYLLVTKRIRFFPRIRQQFLNQESV